MKSLENKVAITTESSSSIDYERIKKAIEFIHSNVHEQAHLKDIASHIGLSEAHFQRMFSRWAGSTPKCYLQTITVEHAKKMLQKQKSILDISLSSSFSSTSRLHEYFIKLEAVTHSEYKTKGIGLEITYAVHTTCFGQAFIAVSKYSICKLSFVENDYGKELNTLKEVWENATFNYSEDKTKDVMEAIFNI